MKKFFSILIILALLSIVGIVGYVALDYVQEKKSLQFTPIISSDSNNNTNEASSTPSTIVSKVDTSKWKIYNNQELGYSIKHPEDLIVNYDTLGLILVFPKDKYFSWPLLDDVKITIVASSTCIADTASSSAEISVDNVKYKSLSSTDVAMGTIYKKDIYEIGGNNACYSITLDSKGTNGSGFYVDNQSLIKKYDNEHKLNIDKVTAIIYGILGSFEIKNIDSGTIES